MKCNPIRNIERTRISTDDATMEVIARLRRALRGIHVPIMESISPAKAHPPDNHGLRIMVIQPMSVNNAPYPPMARRTG